MKQLKKIIISPLTDIDTLNINVVEEKFIDLTSLDGNKTNEFLSKLFDIANISQGVIIGTKQDDKTYINTQIKGAQNKKKIFTFPEPNPICIYYNSANKHLQLSYELKNKLFTEEQHFNADYHYENFIEYFQETAEGITLLSSTIEGFINQLLTENIQLEINNVTKNKNEIEWLDITTKLRQVLPILTGIDYYQLNEKEYTNICLIIDLRNDLIHLKKSVKENRTNYQNLFKRLVDFDHIACSNSVFHFVNAIIPNYLIEKFD
jgi:hypothetical protein